MRPQEQTEVVKDSKKAMVSQTVFKLLIQDHYSGVWLTSNFPVIHPETNFVAWIVISAIGNQGIWVSVWCFLYHRPDWEVEIVLEVQCETIQASYHTSADQSRDHYQLRHLEKNGQNL